MSRTNTPPQIDPAIEQATADFRRDYATVKAEIGKAIVGHDDIIDGVLTCLFVGGHALLEGVPGLGKTALIRALSQALHLKFGRIQFTPDLMPADVIGTNIIQEDEHGRRQFKFMEGPLFAQIILADEINRATPKTQSAMLEAMQERQVTAGGDIRKLERPFFVMATQNPLEQEGTYPLPEAQLDRFFFKLIVQYSGRQELHEILNRTTAGAQPDLTPVLDAKRIIAYQELVRRVVIAPHVQDYAIRVTLATHPGGMYAIPMTGQFLRVGASPRAAQAITLASKVKALLDGRFHVSFADIKAVAIPAMRHRVILNFEGEAEGMTTDMVLERILADTPTSVEEGATVAAAGRR
ncbi:MAG TPA: MoxR family ATPase [Tepidisphaeraceae bacterium]|jgi:MoxR-like ATPase|nr:MoxR family ATPase [Tepidisphaeraceae bacterium]